MLNTSVRAVIIDDRLDEVEPLFHFLNTNGIPTNWFDNDIRNYPQLPLKGVRILFLDFVLVDGQTDPRTIASTLMAAITKVIAKDNGPYALVFWTKHNEDLAIVKNLILTTSEIPKPIAVLDLVKKRCMTKPALIHQTMQKKISNDDVLKVLLSWEKSTHDATCEVLDLLKQKTQPATSTDFDDYVAKSKTGLEKFLYVLANAEEGDNLVESRQVLVRAQMPLTNILYDKLDAKIKKNHKSLKLCKRILSHKTSAAGLFQLSELNTMFLIEIISDSKDTQLRPGNIYKYSNFRRLKPKARLLLPSVSRSGKENSDIIKVLCASTTNYKKFYKDHQENINREAIPIVIEITPPCDYARISRTPIARFIFGLLVPSNRLEGKYPDSENVYRPIPIIKYDNTDFCLIVTDRIYGIERDSLKKLQAPIMRARKELFVDLLAWIGRHLLRPGRIDFS